MKVDGSLKSLLQGVSQQPPRDRLSGQSTAQSNMSADPVTGLTRRPPTDLVGTLGAVGTSASWYDFETENGNKYVASFKNNTLAVYNSNAELQDLTIEADALAYLTGPVSCTTQENEVIVANTEKVVAMNTALSAYTNMGTGSTPQAILQVLGGQYSRTYSISVDGTVVAAYRSFDGSAASESNFIRTTHLAAVLAFLLKNASGAGGAPSGYNAANAQASAGLADAQWVVAVKDDIIHIKRTSGAAFLVSVSDDSGNVNFKSMTETVPDISDLPRMAPQNYLARIATETDPEEDLFLKFVIEPQAGAVASGAGFGKPGYWQECIASSTKYALDAATMPHILEYDPVGDDFTFRRGTWADRLVGTTVSNPDPSFVGNTINDVGTFQNRVVFLSGPNVVMTRTNKLTDFWMGSASAIVDSDPVDMSSNAIQTSRMIYAVPHNKDMVIFAERGQFIVFGRTALTPANATMVLTTAFEASLSARPTPSGRNVFFAMTYGRFAGIREFYTEGGTDINDTRPITQHIKNYITGTVQQLSTASNYDILLVSTDTEQTSLYAYQYIWSDTEKVQSAWSVWPFANSIKYTFFDRDVFYLVTEDAGFYSLLRMPLDVEDSTGMEFPIHLDARFDVFACNTAFVLPADWLADEDLDVVQGVDCPNPGMRAPIASIAYDALIPGYVVTLTTDMEGGDIVVGIKYMSKYVPTMPIVKDDDGVAIGTGNLVIKSFLVSLDATGDINGRAYSRWSAGVEVPFQGRIIGDVGNLVGIPAIYTGQIELPFRSKATDGEIEFYTDSFYPMTMLDIEWIGQYNKRGRRLKTGG